MYELKVIVQEIVRISNDTEKMLDKDVKKINLLKMKSALYKESVRTAQ